MIESTLKSTGLIPLCVRNCTIDIKTGAREERIETQRFVYRGPDSRDERRPSALEPVCTIELVRTAIPSMVISISIETVDSPMMCALVMRLGPEFDRDPTSADVLPYR